MNYKDQWATNENGDRFIFTVEMQRKLHDAGLPIEIASLSALPAQVTPSKPERASEKSYQPVSYCHRTKRIYSFALCVEQLLILK